MSELYSRWSPDEALCHNEHIEAAQKWNENRSVDDRKGIIVLEPQIALNEAIIAFSEDAESLVYSVRKLIQCYQEKSNLSEEDSWNWFIYANYTVKYPNYPIFEDFPANSDHYISEYFKKIEEEEKS